MMAPINSLSGLRDLIQLTDGLNAAEMIRTRYALRCNSLQKSKDTIYVLNGE